MSDDDDCYGPILPTHIVKDSQIDDLNAESCTIGPQIPKQVRNFLEKNIVMVPDPPINVSYDAPDIGPSASDFLKGDALDEEDAFKKYIKLKELREKEEEKNNSSKREEWMVALPNKQKSSTKSFQKRKFDTNGHFVDDTWAQIPSKKKISNPDKEKDLFFKENDFQKAKALLHKESENNIIPQNISQSIVKSSRSKEEKSLIEIHKDLKKQTKKQSASLHKERVPFDREKDMKIQDPQKRHNPSQGVNMQNFLTNKYAKAKFN